MRLDWGMHMADGPPAAAAAVGPAAAAAKAHGLTFAVDFDSKGRATALRSELSRASTCSDAVEDGGLDDDLTGVLRPTRLLVCRFGAAPDTGRVIPMKSIYLVLGGLRAVLHDLEDYNVSFAETSRSEGCAVVATALARVRAANLLKDIGMLTGEPVGLEDLRLVVDLVEETFTTEIAIAREELDRDQISFTSLAESYPPMCKAVMSVGPSNLELGMSVRAVWYQQRDSIFGQEQTLHLELEFVAKIGSYYAVLSCKRTIDCYAGVKSISDLTVRNLHLGGKLAPSQGDKAAANLAARGLQYVEAVTGCQLRAYEAGAFRQEGDSSTTAARGAHCITDMESAIAAGLSLAPGPDAPSEAVQQATAQLARIVRSGNFPSGDSAQRHSAAKMVLVDGLVLLEGVPNSLHWCLFPSLPAFSLEQRCFGHVAVDRLHKVKWQRPESIWESLVIPQDQKELLRAVLLNPVEGAEARLTRGRAEAALFLLRGMPGTGKTFTIETVAQFLQRPVFTVNAQEFGVSSDQVAEQLKQSLRLCSRWGCVFAIDDVDSLNNKVDECGTSGTLIKRVMHQLEQHPGIVFLTAGLKTSLDQAVISRLTLALEYAELGFVARESVWRDLLSKALGSNDIDRQFDLAVLARAELDGWQIRNALRLALALARERGQLLQQSFILQALPSTANKTARPPAAPSPARSPTSSPPSSNTRRPMPMRPMRFPISQVEALAPSDAGNMSEEEQSEAPASSRPPNPSEPGTVLPSPTFWEQEFLPDSDELELALKWPLAGNRMVAGMARADDDDDGLGSSRACTEISVTSPGTDATAEPTVQVEPTVAPLASEAEASEVVERWRTSSPPPVQESRPAAASVPDPPETWRTALPSPRPDMSPNLPTARPGERQWPSARPSDVVSQGAELEIGKFIPGTGTTATPGSSVDLRAYTQGASYCGSSVDLSCSAPRREEPPVQVYTPRPCYPVRASPACEHRLPFETAASQTRDWHSLEAMAAYAAAAYPPQAEEQHANRSPVPSVYSPMPRAQTPMQSSYTSPQLLQQTASQNASPLHQRNQASMTLPINLAMRYAFPGSPGGSQAAPMSRGSSVAVSAAPANLSPMRAQAGPAPYLQGPLLAGRATHSPQAAYVTRMSPSRADPRFGSPFLGAPPSWKPGAGGGSPPPLNFHGAPSFHRPHLSPMGSRSQTPLPTAPQTGYADPVAFGILPTDATERPQSRARASPPTPLDAAPLVEGITSNSETPRITGPAMERCQPIRRSARR